jgi:site-specific DNA-methyltransferase (adenine-specific)
VAKQPASRNRTLTCTSEEIAVLSQQLSTPSISMELASICNRIFHADTFDVLPLLPRESIDLLILDPPYNLTKTYNNLHFKQTSHANYHQWFDSLMALLMPLLKADASLYVCADWKTSMVVAPVLEKYCTVRNRITWEREKGRGAKSNWKNNTEDIWFCTVGSSYFFDVEAVKLKRKVIAPYKENGQPKDWQTEEKGKFRLTHPSNVWTDITVPFWSMPENTEHPTQKPEKLIAKLILASSRANDIILDPFLGSGTTAVVAQKLNRSFIGIEQSQEYGCLALKRLERAKQFPAIQGYEDGVFWERNALR